MKYSQDRSFNPSINNLLRYILKLNTNIVYFVYREVYCDVKQELKALKDYFNNHFQYRLFEIYSAERLNEPRANKIRILFEESSEQRFASVMSNPGRENARRNEGT